MELSDNTILKRDFFPPHSLISLPSPSPPQPSRLLQSPCCFFFFNWRIIALQNFAVFCQIPTWSSHRYIRPLPFEPPTHHPPWPTPVCCYRAPVWVSWAGQQIPTGSLFYTWECKLLCYWKEILISLPLSFAVQPGQNEHTFSRAAACFSRRYFSLQRSHTRYHVLPPMPPSPQLPAHPPQKCPMLL